MNQGTNPDQHAHEGSSTKEDEEEIGTGVYVTELHPLDVLLGRGSGPSMHQGNVKFRKIVEGLKPIYMSTKSRKSKSNMVHNTVNNIKRQGGRFLVRISKATKKARRDQPRGHAPEEAVLYEVVKDHVACEKMKQAIRYVQYKKDPTGKSRGASTTTLSTDHQAKMPAIANVIKSSISGGQPLSNLPFSAQNPRGSGSDGNREMNTSSYPYNVGGTMLPTTHVDNNSTSTAAQLPMLQRSGVPNVNFLPQMEFSSSANIFPDVPWLHPAFVASGGGAFQQHQPFPARTSHSEMQARLGRQPFQASRAAAFENPGMYDDRSSSFGLCPSAIPSAPLLNRWLMPSSLSGFPQQQQHHHHQPHTDASRSLSSSTMHGDRSVASGLNPSPSSMLLPNSPSLDLRSSLTTTMPASATPAVTLSSTHMMPLDMFDNVPQLDKQNRSVAIATMANPITNSQPQQQPTLLNENRTSLEHLPSSRALRQPQILGRAGPQVPSQPASLPLQLHSDEPQLLLASLSSSDESGNAAISSTGVDDDVNG